MKSDSRKNVSFTEFALGVTCEYFNIPLIAIEPDKESPNRVNFIYERTPELDRIVRDFWNDQLSVSPRRWHAHSRELKARIRAELTLSGRGQHA